MYVCVCKAISDKKVRQAIVGGCASVRALKDQTGLGSVCGRCVPEARAMIEAQRAAMPPTQPISLAQLTASSGLTSVAA